MVMIFIGLPHFGGGMLDKRVQQARYEKYVFELAKAYKGYRLYFPAFIDFRGRISRSGMLHFHEL